MTFKRIIRAVTCALFHPRRLIATTSIGDMYACVRCQHGTHGTQQKDA
jgi:hypothetical protein